MLRAANKVYDLEKVTSVVSGGAAWADNIAIELALMRDCPLKLFLPKDEKDLETAAYYHARQKEKINVDGIAMIKEFAADTIYHGKFKDRNTLVANHADVFLACTFGDGKILKDGGTKDTVDKMLAAGKRGYHLNLNEERLWEI